MTPFYRTPEQQAEYLEYYDKLYRDHFARGGDADNFCPFCDRDHMKKDIVDELGYWIVADNPYPYEGAKIHRIVFPKKHIESWDKLYVYVFRDLMGSIYDVMGEARLVLNPPKDQSIKHIHFHVIQY